MSDPIKENEQSDWLDEMKSFQERISSEATQRAKEKAIQIVEEELSRVMDESEEATIIAHDIEIRIQEEI